MPGKTARSRVAKSAPRAKARFLLIDISNTFTKVALSDGTRIGRVSRIPTARLAAKALRPFSRGVTLVVAASVVPAKNAEVNSAAECPVCWVGPGIELGIGVDYPKPETIGADRLANAVACAELYGAPAVVVDFGTAVTFDVVSPDRKYIGGVIAPGLSAMTEYLHRRTALLPEIRLAEPIRAVGKTTKQAMLSGAVHGYRGLVREILAQVKKEQFPKHKVRVVATGGDAELIGGGLGIFDAIDPHITLEGLRLIALANSKT
jgi:type III pantothenate kinase